MIDIIKQLNLLSPVEIILISAGCVVCTNMVKKTKINNSFMPLVCCGFGVLFSVWVAYSMHDVNVGKATLAGFLIGGTTTGGWTFVKDVTGGYDTNESDAEKALITLGKAFLNQQTKNSENTAIIKKDESSSGETTNKKVSDSENSRNSYEEKGDI